MAEQRLLLTAFEPFADRPTNSSLELLRHAYLEALSDRFECLIEFKVLPVSWERTLPVLTQAIEAFDPTVVVSFGESLSPHLKVETLARNWREGSLSDNDQIKHEGAKIIEALPATLHCAWPAQKLLDAITTLIEGVELSDDAGSFLCNYVLFELCSKGPAMGISSSGFIHVPVGFETRFPSTNDLASFSNGLLSKIIAVLLNERQGIRAGHA